MPVVIVSSNPEVDIHASIELPDFIRVASVDEASQLRVPVVHLVLDMHPYLSVPKGMGWLENVGVTFFAGIDGLRNAIHTGALDNLYPQT